MPKMVKFRATKKGYYGDVIHDPDTDHHVIFDAPEDFQCSWAERVDGKAVKPKAKPEVSEETLAAEQVLDNEAAASAEVIAETTAEDDDIPAATEDANEAAGVEVL